MHFSPYNVSEVSYPQIANNDRMNFAQKCFIGLGKTGQKSSICAVEVMVALCYNVVYKYDFLVWPIYSHPNETKILFLTENKMKTSELTARHVIPFPFPMR